MPDALHIIKLGGSLLDDDDLITSWERWCAAANIPSGRELLIVGGGAAADTVRAFDHRFGLSPEAAHWSAIAAMEVGARMVAARLADCMLAADPDEASAAMRQRRVAVMSPLAWLQRDHPDMPATWDFTSDSIAALVAQTLGADRLTLLKSTAPPAPCTLAEAAAQGIVDPCFSHAAAEVPRIELVNLRGDCRRAVPLRHR